MEVRETMYRKTPSRKRQRGFSLIELMIAMLVLTIGLVGGMIILIVAMASNSKAHYDTNAVALSQSTLDRIIVISNSATTLTTSIIDCNGVAHPVNTAPGGAPLLASDKSIDFSQAPVDGYQMTFALCAAGGSGQIGTPTTYDVRWRVDAFATPAPGAPPSPAVQLVSIAAKRVGSQTGQLQGDFFLLPITLHALRGN